MVLNFKCPDVYGPPELSLCPSRMFIWRSILRLPENHSAYGALVDKGTHPRYEKLHEKFPIKSRKLLRVLQR